MHSCTPLPQINHHHHVPLDHHIPKGQARQGQIMMMWALEWLIPVSLNQRVVSACKSEIGICLTRQKLEQGKTSLHCWHTHTHTHTHTHQNQCQGLLELRLAPWITPLHNYKESTQQTKYHACQISASLAAAADWTTLQGCNHKEQLDIKNCWQCK